MWYLDKPKETANWLIMWCLDKPKETAKVPEPPAPKPMGDDLDDDDEEEKDDVNKISRKKLRKMNRLTVAELKQVDISIWLDIFYVNRS